MNKEELIEVLRQFDEKRVEELPEKARNIFYAIMKIADERDRLNNILNELEKYIIDEIDDAQEELNAILQGNDLEYKNECTKEFNCIKNALDMLLDKITELKENNK